MGPPIHSTYKPVSSATKKEEFNKIHENEKSGEKSGANYRTSYGSSSNRNERHDRFHDQPKSVPNMSNTARTSASVSSMPASTTLSTELKDDSFLSAAKKEAVGEQASLQRESVENQPVVAPAFTEKKFTGRCRLFVGNLPTDISEQEFGKLFEPFGEFAESYINSQRGFGFIRLDTRMHAETARQTLDGQIVKNRPLRVRFATHGAALRIKYLPLHISNEILEETFAKFGEVERAVVVIDERGKSTGEGIVEFARKISAQTALARITEGVLLMSASLRPIMAEPLEQKDENDGFPEKFIQITPDVMKDREQAPRFVQPGTFEFEIGLKWKELYRKRQEGEENLRRQFEEEVGKLELDTESAMMLHHTEMMRQDLLRRQEELARLEEQTQLEVQRRMELRRKEEERRRVEEEWRRQEMAIIRQQQKEYYGHGPDQMVMRGERMPNTMQPPPVPPAGLGAMGHGRHMGQGMGSDGMGDGSAYAGTPGGEMEGGSMDSTQLYHQYGYDPSLGYQGNVGETADKNNGLGGGSQVAHKMGSGSAEEFSTGSKNESGAGGSRGRDRPGQRDEQDSSQRRKELSAKDDHARGGGGGGAPPQRGGFAGRDNRGHQRGDEAGSFDEQKRQRRY